MPKQLYRLNDFSGGLNKLQDGADIQDNEVQEAQNVMFNVYGGIQPAYSFSQSNNKISSYSTSFTDSWTVTTAGEYRTDSFTFSCILPTSGHSNYTTANYQITLSNLVPKFQPGTTQRLRVNVKDRTTSLKSITGSSTAANNYTVKSGKIQIREKYTDDIEVNDFDISYDSEGNFFDLDTNLLYVGIPYKVYMELDVRGDTFFYDFPDKWDFVVGATYNTEDTNPSSMPRIARDSNFDVGLL